MLSGFFLNIIVPVLYSMQFGRPGSRTVKSCGIFLFCQPMNTLPTEIRLLRTDSSDENFNMLVQELDAELATRDGAEHAFYAQFNGIVNIPFVVIAFSNEQPIACGAIKAFEEGSMEVKRMYTVPAWRGKGVAMEVLKELEAWARELGYDSTVLETGKRQPEAIRLYEKNGYRIIPNYGQYAGIENSVCFEKSLD